MPLIQTTPPGVEPVTTADFVKNFARVDADLTMDDALFGLLITAARAYAEAYTGRSFITQGWRLVMDSFPGPSLMGVPWGVPFSMPGHAIQLEKAPVISITGITYTAMDGSTQTMPPADYVSDLSGPVPRITPGFGKIWPIPLPQIGSVKVDYQAGYGALGTDVPAGIRHWILVRVNTMRNNREEAVVLDRGSVASLPWMDTLLDPYKVVQL